ncbi:hypothetical protein IWW50_001929 [Coemansia erecta]|nr:hypothetical protein IWW50_001929 [Coemansia erecta]
MPVALQVDHEKMLQFDIDVRSEIIRFIWQEIPASSSESKEIALLRTLELLNGEIAVLRGLYEAILPRIMNDRNVDGLEDEDRDIADPEVLNGVPNSQLAQVVGREFARTHFNELKCVFLEAMIHNHPFRPCIATS